MLPATGHNQVTFSKSIWYCKGLCVLERIANLMTRWLPDPRRDGCHDATLRQWQLNTRIALVSSRVVTIHFGLFYPGP